MVVVNETIYSGYDEPSAISKVAIADSSLIGVEFSPQVPEKENVLQGYSPLTLAASATPPRTHATSPQNLRMLDRV
jgi:hypothetical protein